MLPLFRRTSRKSKAVLREQEACDLLTIEGTKTLQYLEEQTYKLVDPSAQEGYTPVPWYIYKYERPDLASTWPRYIPRDIVGKMEREHQDPVSHRTVLLRFKVEHLAEGQYMLLPPGLDLCYTGHTIWVVYKWHILDPLPLRLEHVNTIAYTFLTKAAEPPPAYVSHVTSLAGTRVPSRRASNANLLQQAAERAREGRQTLGSRLPPPLHLSALLNNLNLRSRLRALSPTRGLQEEEVVEPPPYTSEAGVIYSPGILSVRNSTTTLPQYQPFEIPPGLNALDEISRAQLQSLSKEGCRVESRSKSVQVMREGWYDQRRSSK